MLPLLCLCRVITTYKKINSGDALVLTELILENALAAYEPAEVAALLSAFVFNESSTAPQPETYPSPQLQAGVTQILDVAERVGAAQVRRGITGEDVYAEGRLGFGLVEVVYEWARGVPFAQITTMTEVPEGTIVRVITRLDEVCREVRDAGRVIGDAGLMKKMEEAQGLIKRDSMIVFLVQCFILIAHRFSCICSELVLLKNGEKLGVSLREYDDV